MMAKQTRKIQGIVKIIRKTEKEAVKYEGTFGGPMFEHILDADAKAILTLWFVPARPMKSTYEQILHLLNLDLTPVCKGAFCCPLHSHASVFRFRSKLELLGPSMENSVSN